MVIYSFLKRSKTKEEPAEPLQNKKLKPHLCEKKSANGDPYQPKINAKLVKPGVRSVLYGSVCLEFRVTGLNLGHFLYLPETTPEVDRTWCIWGSYDNIPRAIFYLLGEGL